MRAPWKALGSKKAWVLPKGESKFAPEGTWTNHDTDVTGVEHRTWGAWTLVGCWFSDALNAQGWEGASSVIAVGLSWREAIPCLILGYLIVAIPMTLNGAIGATLHIPFPVVARASFGYQFSKVAVILRAITALFWHSIQTYTGSQALTQMIRAIWPSYMHLKNHLPESAGVTTQELLSFFLFWLIQLPFLLIHPRKLKWFFMAKGLYVPVAALATVIALTVMAGGSGPIFAQHSRVHGSEKAWLFLSSMSSITGGWATMATNIADFTRYMDNPRKQYLQLPLVPVLCSMLGIFGIIATSATMPLYGDYLWNPLDVAAEWHGHGGRAAAFFVGLCWALAQIGTNVTANVTSCSNDLSSLFPKYLNIQRSAFLVTLIGAWALVPWKILSASSLLTFMSSLSIFLAGLTAVLISDYWIVRRRKVDVPALYNPHGRYRYWHGINWRAALALCVSVGPNLPGMVHALDSTISIGSVRHIYDINYIWGFLSAMVVYVLVSTLFPPADTFVPKTCYGDESLVEGQVIEEIPETKPSKEEKAVELQ